MLIRIDPRSERPIYLQIAGAIEGHVLDGSLMPGERLPSARSLASSLGVNMHTVLKAYAHLQELSIVEMRRGRGGVVVGDVPDVERIARGLVAAAQRSGMTKSGLKGLIGEVW